jgi:prepilin-type N-terminal cleavage/methylation domain-containing protein
MQHPAPPQRSRPRGFTLVELLAVIMIIAMLAALITPAVMRALASARNAAIKAEIDMLHMAIMNYKNEYGSFPPCLSGAVPPIREVRHLRRLFPRLATDSDALNQIALARTGTSGAITDSTCMNQITQLTPRTALVFWLDGFTSDPTSPLYPYSSRQKLYDFDSSRKSQTTTTPRRFTGAYFASGKPEAEYWYMPSGTPAAELAVVGMRLVFDQNGVIFNKDTFQIVSPGRDGIWHEDYNDNNILDLGEDLNGNSVLDKSDDDLSNFWPGTRQDYLDSLRN